MLKTLITFWFKKARWRFSGNLPKKEKRTLFIAAPTQRKTDFLLAVAIINLTRFKSRIMVNKKWWRLPYSAVLKSLGAKPFDCDNSREQWKQITNWYNERKRFSLIYSPEMCLDPNGNWKVDFLRTARKLGIPIVMVGIDRATKTVRFHSLFHPSSDLQRDIHYMQRWYDSFTEDEMQESEFLVSESVKPT